MLGRGFHEGRFRSSPDGDKDLAGVLQTQKGSKAIAATCIPVHILCRVESMASGNEPVSGPLQCFTGIVVLCAAGLKRSANVQHVNGDPAVLADDALVLETYKSKRKDEVMIRACPRFSVTGIDWAPSACASSTYQQTIL